MSGHSKWSTIKRQKGATDAKRGQLFTKLSNGISIAIREGGGIVDPEFNFKLRIAIDRARASNMPKDNIERAIEKAKGGGASDLSEAVYEGFAPGGASVMVQAVTDNKQRTISEIKNVFEKNGASLGSQGAVSYLFDLKGELVIKKNGRSTDEILDLALNAGIDDIEEEKDDIFIYTDPSQLSEVKKKLEASALPIETAELIYKPKNTIPLDRSALEKLVNFLEKIEDLSDVQKVFTNANFSLLDEKNP